MYNKTVLSKIILIVLVWVLAGLFITAHEYFFLSNYPGILNTEPLAQYNFTNNLIAACFSLGVGALIYCLFEFFIFKKSPSGFDFGKR